MQGKRWLMGAAAAALLLTMTAGCGDKGGQSGGGSGKLPINSVSLPEKLDGDVIKILEMCIRDRLFPAALCAVFHPHDGVKPLPDQQRGHVLSGGHDAHHRRCV